MKKLLLLLASSLILAACTHNGLLSPEPVATPLPSDSALEPPGNETPIFPSDPNDSGITECGITNCHGLEIECGSDIPQACTMQYELGDFCRQFAECGVIDGSCQQMENSTFKECKSCVEECLEQPDIESQFQCEEQCRSQIQPD